MLLHVVKDNPIYSVNKGNVSSVLKHKDLLYCNSVEFVNISHTQWDNVSFEVNPYSRSEEFHYVTELQLECGCSYAGAPI